MITSSSALEALHRIFTERGAIRAAVLADWEVVDDRRCRVRRLEVARTVAARMGVTLRYRTFIPKVNAEVRLLGAEAVTHSNIGLWRRLRRRT